MTYSVRFYGKVTQEHDPETDTYSVTEISVGSLVGVWLEHH